jgi:ribose transport system permease protein
MMGTTSRAPTTATPGRRRINFGFDRFSGLYLWALFIIIFGIWVPNLFLTANTVHSVAANQAIAGVMGIAVLVPLACGSFDLSVGSVANLSTVVAVAMQSAHHWNMAAAIILAIAVSAVIGVVNGFIVVGMRVNSFIATLGTATVVSAVQDIVAGNGQPLPPSSPTWSSLTQATVGGFQVIIIYLLVIAIAAWWALQHTPAGRYLYAIGGNVEAARLAGVRVGQWTWLSLIVSATLSGVAGVLYGSLFGPALDFGPALLLPAFAAAFLGSTQLKRGRYNVWGSLIAVYVLATGVKGLSLVTGVQWLNDMFNGIALIAAVGFAGWRQRKALSFRFRDRRASDSGGGTVPAEEDRPVPAKPT